MQPAVPVEALALPDLFDRHVVGVREEIGGPERNVLSAQGNPPKRVDIEPFERPDARLLLRSWQRSIQMRIKRLSGLDMRVVIPCQELARDDLVHADVLEPEVHGLVESAFDLLLSDD